MWEEICECAGAQQQMMQIVDCSVAQIETEEMTSRQPVVSNVGT